MYFFFSWHFHVIFMYFLLQCIYFSNLSDQNLRRCGTLPPNMVMVMYNNVKSSPLRTFVEWYWSVYWSNNSLLASKIPHQLGSNQNTDTQIVPQFKLIPKRHSWYSNKTVGPRFQCKHSTAEAVCKIRRASTTTKHLQR